MMKLAGMTLSVAGQYAKGRLGRALRSGEAAEEAGHVAAMEAGAKIARTLGELKGAAMKVGQMASMAGDLLPAEFADALRSLQKDAEPMDYAVIEGQIRSEFGQPVETLFSDFEREPFASASIGQVHRARTDDGREVVVKVQYPGVDGAVDSDMRHLKFALRASGLVRADRASFDAAFEEIRARMHEELDYCNEADNVRAFHAFHRQHAFVRIPQVVGERSAKRVLTLTYEAGDGVADMRALGYTREERDRCGSNLWAAAESQAFDFGRIHADPNPGNFAFRRDGTVVMYDFGCVKTLAPHVMPGYAELVSRGLHRDYPAADLALQSLGVRNPDGPVPPEALYARVRDWLAEPFIGSEDFHFGRASFEKRVLPEIAPAVLKHLNSFRPAQELVFFNRAIVGHYATLRAMGATVPVQRMLTARIDGIEGVLGLAAR